MSTVNQTASVPGLFVASPVVPDAPYPLLVLHSTAPDTRVV